MLAATACSKGGDKPMPETSSPYITKVFDYQPAPGQYVNKLPVWIESETKADILAKIEEGFKGRAQGASITLGGFGGYVVFGFDHTIENVEGLCDVRILGNAMGNSSEPGIIMVSRDDNQNGEADDEWYEIVGSAHGDEQTIRNYSITYKAPATNDDGQQVIVWSDNQGTSGEIKINEYHTNSYFPSWLDATELTFSGTRLRNVAQNTAEADQTPFWQFTPLDYGYADNASNIDDRSAIDIAWAVDAEGNPAELNGIDFIKVYCSQNQVAGWLGEVSTEVSGAEDLHMQNIEIPTR